MNKLTRRQFSLFGMSGLASAVLVACGNDIIDSDDVAPTKIADVPGAPVPTLADMATPGSEQGGDEGDTGGEGTAPTGDVIVVQALDTMRFDPDTITASPGQTIRVENGGFVPHDFSIDEFGGKLIDVPSQGATGEWTVPDDAELGEYEFYCSVPGHRASGMHGIITIAEASEAPAGDSGEEEATPAGEQQPEGEGEAPAGEGGGGATIELVALTPFNWDVTEITASPGDIIHVVSDSPLPHDFAIEEFGGVLIDLPSQGTEGTWEVPGEPGTYLYYCTIPGHRENGMEGTLTIQ